MSLRSMAVMLCLVPLFAGTLVGAEDPVDRQAVRTIETLRRAVAELRAHDEARRWEAEAGLAELTAELDRRLDAEGDNGAAAP